MVKTSKPQKKLFELKRKTNRRRESNPSRLIIDERPHHRHERKLVHSNGEVTEWPIVQHWKCCVPQGTAGSNPALSAISVKLSFRERRPWRPRKIEPKPNPEAQEHFSVHWNWENSPDQQPGRQFFRKGPLFRHLREKGHPLR